MDEERLSLFKASIEAQRREIERIFDRIEERRQGVELPRFGGQFAAWPAESKQVHRSSTGGTRKNCVQEVRG